MHKTKNKKAFTMIELIFVIVVIGILAGVAVPRLASTRDDSEITKAMIMLNSIRNALSIERQKRILRGQFTQIDAVGSGTTVFGNFFSGGVDLNIPVLEYPELSSSDKYHWRRVDDIHTYFCLSNTCNGNTDTIKFELEKGRFICKEEDIDSGKCSMFGITAE